MLPQKGPYTSDDYWNLPEGERAELINGQFYAMAPPAGFIKNCVFSFPNKLITTLFRKKETARSTPLPSPSIWMQRIRTGWSRIFPLSAISPS